MRLQGLENRHATHPTTNKKRFGVFACGERLVLPFVKHCETSEAPLSFNMPHGQWGNFGELGTFRSLGWPGSNSIVNYVMDLRPSEKQAPKPGRFGYTCNLINN